MAKFDAALQSRPYLGGERPNRLDITVAALLAPLCRPREHVMNWPELPEPLAEFAQEFAGRPTWHHALDMYRRHRAIGPHPLSAEKKPNTRRPST
jgi:glutathione S-transferase